MWEILFIVICSWGDAKNLWEAGLSFKSRTKKAYASSVRCSKQGPPPTWPGTALVDEDRKVWDGPKPFSIIGSIGSIRTQTLDIVVEHPNELKVVALAAGSNVTFLVDQVRTFKPKLVSVCHASLAVELKDALADVEPKPEIVFGEEGMVQAYHYMVEIYMHGNHDYFSQSHTKRLQKCL